MPDPGFWISMIFVTASMIAAGKLAVYLAELPEASAVRVRREGPARR